MAAANNPVDHGALLRQALRAVEQMKQKLAAAESRAHQPIAIIGMGCRFPGDVDDSESFWDLLQQGREAIREVPADRWNVDDYYDPDPSRPGKMVSRFGGFLRQIDQFDAAFFGIAPREAAMMDPQQRLLLEITWEALERAGLPPRSLAGSPTAMYLGIASGDYGQLQLHAGDPALLDVHYASGNAHSIASGRLSYLLGLKGPSLSIDTACSSSLVAVHLACQALRSGECTLAIAGGVNVILAPETTVALSHAHMMSPDGRSKAFDDSADGFARAEGCGVVILKPLAQALADGDNVLAVIRGTALNQDGASSSLTAPHGPSQEDLMRRALLDAGCEASQVDYVETHGTGTSLGDPIELRALGAVYGQAHSAARPLWIGSLKTNLGHMEAAAGLGGLIKLVLSLQHELIPAHLLFQTPTRHVSWTDLNLAVPTSLTPWPVSTRPDGTCAPRLGAVSSFGFSGTNAHLIVEQAPATLAPPTPEEISNHPKILPLSAAGPEALAALVKRYLEWLPSPSAQTFTWTEIAATAAQCRDHLRSRCVVVARNREEAAAQFARLPDPNHAPASSAPPLCFLFTGQGSEHPGMGLDLLQGNSVFRASIDRLERALDGSLGVSIPQIWASLNGELEQARLVQPALFAFGWALCELWRSWGVEPTTVLGHSLGEYIAATVAGVLSPEDAIRLVAARGRLTGQLAQPGAMIAVVAPESEIRRLLEESCSQDTLSIAAMNGPESIVVSGTITAIDDFESILRAGELRHKRLRTSHGFHSAALEPMLDVFAHEAAAVPFRVPEIRWIANMTGEAVSRHKPVDAGYWRQHLRQTVQFQKSLITVEASGSPLYLELGTQPQLLALAENSGIPADRRVASLRRSGSESDEHKLLTAAAQLFALGIDLDWKGLFEGRPFRRASLPTYPFQRQRFWFTDHRTASPKAVSPTPDRSPTGHPLLGDRLRLRSGSATFHATLSPTSPAHLGDHIVLGQRVLPGAAYLEMALAAAHAADAGSAWTARDVEFREVCVFDQPRLLETALLPPQDESGRRGFEIASAPLPETTAGEPGDLAWTLHATGILAPATPTASAAFDLEAVRSRTTQTWNPGSFYARFQTIGLDFGRALQSIRQAWGGEEESLVAIELLPAVNGEAHLYSIHPILLDACLQAAAALGMSSANASPALPAALGNIRLNGNPASLRYARALVRSRQGRALTVDITGLDSDGVPLLFIEGLTLVEPEQDPYRGWLHQVEWEQLAIALPPSPALSGHLDVEALNARLALLAEENDLASFDAWEPDFDRLCAAWIIRAFEQAGFAFHPGCDFHAEDLLAALAVAPQHRRLTLRFLEILCEAGYLLPIASGQFQSSNLPRLTIEGFPEIKALSDRLRQDGYPEMAWTEHIVPHLLPLLRGEVQPVDILFSEENRPLATRLYRESVVARTLNPVFAAAALQAAAKRNGAARVLEVGGGTAATTSYLISALRGHIAEYVFTDIGAGFVAAAKHEFDGIDGMRFQTLDLEQSPAEQGLDGQSFDIIVASNVLHATADLRQTLRHLRSVLAPGGILLLAETFAGQPWIDLTVGFTSGWWRFTDTDLRPSYTLIHRQAWVDLLRDSGFVSHISLPDAAQGVLSNQGLLVAFAPVDTADANTITGGKPQVLIVSSGLENEPIAASLAQAARDDGAEVTIASASASRSVLDPWLETLTLDPQASRHIFFLPGAELQEFPADHAAYNPLTWQQTVLLGALAWTQALLAGGHAAKLWLVSRGAYGPSATDPNGASLAAFGRSLRTESPEVRAIAVDLDPSETFPHQAQRLWQLARQSSLTGAQFALRGNGVWAPRLTPFKLAPPSFAEAAETRRLHLAGSGLLQDLKPAAEPRQAPAAHQVEISVRAVAINFHEVLSACVPGEAHQDPPGGECAGTVVAIGSAVTDLAVGDEVLALASGLMSDFATLSRDRVWKKPPSLSPEESATILIPFLTARWSLETVARLQPGETVLIHAAAGGVGLAAIQEAKRLGARFYATAGRNAKRQLLRELGAEGVFDSRTNAFESEIMLATGFRGVDVVLNSLAGEKTTAGLRALASRGRFVELGEHTALTASEVAAIRPDVIYHRVHLRAALASLTPEIRAAVDSIVGDAAEGKILPLPWKGFELSQAAEAFRFMAAGHHVGRVLLLPGATPSAQLFRVRKDGAYVVTGGLSGLGRLVVEWLAMRGAGCVLALGRRTPDAETSALFGRLADSGTAILTRSCDVSIREDLASALHAIPAHFTLRGVFHAAGVLDDASLVRQNPARFRAVLAPKVAGAWNLHQLTQGAPLDCFVLFSSAAAIFGSPGQANHAAANACLDALAHYRRDRLGLTALSINWGAWRETGAAVRHGVIERTEFSGVRSISPSEGLDLLERLLREDCTQALVSHIDWPTWSRHAKVEAAANADLLTHVLARSKALPRTASPPAASFPAAAQPGHCAGSSTWKSTWLAGPESQRRALLDTHLEERIRSVLSMPSQPIDPARPLQEYGLDSLLSIELRNTLSADLETKLPATALFDYPTLASLTNWLFHDVLKMPATPILNEAGQPSDVLTGVATLSDDEIDRLLQKKMAGTGNMAGTAR